MYERNDIRQQIAALLEVDVAEVVDGAALFDIVTSSFRIVELVIELQELYGVRFHQEDMQAVATIGDLLDLIVRRLPRTGTDR